MPKLNLNKTVIAILLTLGTANFAASMGVADTSVTMQEALNASIRGEDSDRDESRKPAETLAFFEVKNTSTVLEITPGRGWYTKILGTYLKESGKLYVSVRADVQRLKLEENGLQHVVLLEQSNELQRTDIPTLFDASNVDFGVTDVDVALTFRNVHNLTVGARAEINKGVFRALKPGGVYGIVGHTKRHMEKYDEERWRRTDPVQIIKEVLAAGFIFEDYSDLHARPTDDLIFDTTDDSIEGDSDRFTLKFRKPK